MLRFVMLAAIAAVSIAPVAAAQGTGRGSDGLDRTGPPPRALAIKFECKTLTELGSLDLVLRITPTSKAVPAGTKVKWKVQGSGSGVETLPALTKGHGHHFTPLIRPVPAGTPCSAELQF